MQAYARFGRSSDQIPEARAFVRATLSRWGEISVVDGALLVTSELFTNAVIHGSGRIDVYVTLDPEALRIAVVDDGRRIPDRWPRREAMPTLGGARPADRRHRCVHMGEQLRPGRPDPGMGGDAARVRPRVFGRRFQARGGTQ